jgi:hypothetical protein
MDDRICVIIVRVGYTSETNVDHDDDRPTGYVELRVTLPLPFIPTEGRKLCFDGENKVEVMETVYDLMAKRFRVKTRSIVIRDKERFNEFVQMLTAKGWEKLIEESKSSETGPLSYLRDT